MILLPHIIKKKKDLLFWIDFIIRIHKSVVIRTNEPSYVLPSTRQKLTAIIATSLNYYTSPREKVMALFYYLIKDHPFLNANKRTAVAILLFLCQMWRLEKCPAGNSLVTLSLKIAKKELGLDELLKQV